MLIVSADAPVDRPRLTQLIERGPDVGIHTIFVAPTVESLPAACRTFVDVTDGLDAARVGYVRAGGVHAGARRGRLEQLCRGVRPPDRSGRRREHRRGGRERPPAQRVDGGTPRAGRGGGPASVVERWHQNNSILDRSGAALPRLKRAGTLKAFIGQGSPDAMSLDLRTQGPHALVGGTTGAGKSEFLQAWVLGMAAEYSPDRVTFLFVDYKGGSAFADCVELPHCVGLVTDLSPHLVRRALTSLRAELHHREHLFNRKKAKDLLELEKRRDPETPPALVLVIDEFAALAGEVPEFVDGVVDIAQRGRSLGIHLIMATQRPAGVIKDNLRANTNLRVALRMADESDSRDVVGDPVAASFDPSIPGRGIAKTGPGRLVGFQSAYAGGWTTDEPSCRRGPDRGAALRLPGGLGARRAPNRTRTTRIRAQRPEADGRHVRGRGRRARIPAPRRPWLDELADRGRHRALPAVGDGEIVFGLADIPERQLQEPMSFTPDRDGAMLVYGTSGVGQVHAAAHHRHRGGTAARPRGGAGVRARLRRRRAPVARVAPARRRGHRGRRRGAGAAAAAHPRRPPRPARPGVQRGECGEPHRVPPITGLREPRVVLLLDGFGQFKAEWDTTTVRMPLYNVFMRILAEGRPLGVHVVATADRAGAVPTAVSANVTKRIVLRLSEESAYQVLGVPKDVLGERRCPAARSSRGSRRSSPCSAAPRTWPRSPRRIRAGGPAPRRRSRRGAGDRRAAHVVRRRRPPRRGRGLPVLGLADDTLAPLGFEPVGTFVVTGPPQSGKTTALRALTESVRGSTPTCASSTSAVAVPPSATPRPWMRSATTVDR